MRRAPGPRPAAALALLVGSVLSIATTPEGEPTSVWVDSAPWTGSFTVEPGADGALALVAEIACVSPSPLGGELPVLNGPWLEVEMGVTPLDDGPDTAARTHVSAVATGDGFREAWEDEAYLMDGPERLHVETDFGGGCVLGARCTQAMTVTVEADAAVQVEWRATASVEWRLGPGNACLVFVNEA